MIQFIIASKEKDAPPQKKTLVCTILAFPLDYVDVFYGRPLMYIMSIDELWLNPYH